jgi:hypothetical protein
MGTILLMVVNRVVMMEFLILKLTKFVSSHSPIPSSTRIDLRFDPESYINQYVQARPPITNCRRYVQTYIHNWSVGKTFCNEAAVAY